VEYVANEIKAYFNLDLSLIRGYRLGDDATRLLIALSLLKVRRFLDSSLRLRTACDLELVGEVRAKAPADFTLPSESELLTEAQAGIKVCAPLFANPPVTILKTKVKVVEKKDGDKSAGAGPL
jgi:CRISPR-associated protein Csb1